jgi:hypothetical protein
MDETKTKAPEVKLPDTPEPTIPEPEVAPKPEDGKPPGKLVSKQVVKMEPQLTPEQKADQCWKEIQKILEKYDCVIGAEPLIDPRQVIGILQNLISAKPVILPSNKRR